MRLERIDPAVEKEWSIGPWNSSLPVSIGYASRGIDEPHYHREVIEIYLVASGSAVVQIGKTSFAIEQGYILLIEPGEAHTFLSSTPDYFHFVLHIPGLTGESAALDKVPVPRQQPEL